MEKKQRKKSRNNLFPSSTNEEIITVKKLCFEAKPPRNNMHVNRHQKDFLTGAMEKYKVPNGFD